MEIIVINTLVGSNDQRTVINEFSAGSVPLEGAGDESNEQLAIVGANSYAEAYVREPFHPKTAESPYTIYH